MLQSVRNWDNWPDNTAILLMLLWCVCVVGWLVVTFSVIFEWVGVISYLSRFFLLLSLSCVCDVCFVIYLFSLCLIIAINKYEWFQLSKIIKSNNFAEKTIFMTWKWTGLLIKS